MAEISAKIKGSTELMKQFYSKANEIEGTSTEGSIVAYYCAHSP